jgi:hypothetical protein
MDACVMSRRTEHAVSRLIFNIMHFRPCESKSIGCWATNDKRVQESAASTNACRIGSACLLITFLPEVCVHAGDGELFRSAPIDFIGRRKQRLIALVVRRPDALRFPVSASRADRCVAPARKHTCELVEQKHSESVELRPSTAERTLTLFRTDGGA